MKDSLGLVCVLSLAASAPAQNWFKAPQFATNGQTYRHVGDLDGDGRLDLLAAQGSNRQVLLGQAGGAFAPGAPFALPIASNGYDALIDIDADGRLDLVYTAASPALAVVVLPGQAGGAFGAPIQVPIPASGARVRGGDGNGDGVQDIAVDGYNVLLGGPVVFWILGNPNLHFQVTAPLVLAPTADPKGVCVFDRDGDGDDDLAICSRGAVLLALSQPGGVLTAGPSIAIGGLDAWIAAADLDQDLDVDLVTVHQVGAGGVLTRLVNQGASFATAATPLQTFAAVGQPHAGDWNGDGFPDVLVRGFSSSGYYTLFGNDGAGLLAEAWSRAYLVTGNLAQPGLADVDGDGHLDFVDTSMLLCGDGTLADPQGGPLLGDLTIVDDQDDGDLDATDGILTYRNDGTGAFAQRAITLPPGPAPGRFFGFVCAFADFDGDGLREALVTVHSLPFPNNPVFEVMHRLEEQSDGTFVDLGPAAAPGLFLDLPSFAADTNGDGVLDVVSPTAVWVNNGAHTFTPLPPAFGGFKPLQPGDVDGDGRVDFLAGFGGVGQGIAILRQTGGNAFAVNVLASATSFSGRHQPALVDFDDDGDLDVAADVSLGGGGPQIWLNQGGVFTPGPAFVLPGTGDSSCLGGDIDGDGRTDFAFASADRLWVLRRSGAGLTYDAPVVFAIDGVRALVDVDQDGDLDAFGRGVAHGRRFDGPTAGRRRQYGQPSPGLGGRLPVLGCAGVVRTGQTPVLRLRQAVGGAFALLTMGWSESNFPSPVVPGLVGYGYPFAATLGFLLGGAPGVAGQGALDLPLAIPPGFAGTRLYFQGFVFDVGSPNGIPHTGGLEFTIGG